jgi:hypothetical protein
MSGSTIHIGGALLKVVDNALSFTPAGSPTPINLSNDINPSLLYSANSNVTVTANFVNVAINSNTVASFGAGGITTTANVSATYIIGDGSQLTGLPAGYANTNVAAYLPEYSGTISALTTANTNMKGYVDGQITTVTNSVTGANAAIITANTAMKGYVDGQISTTTTATTTANTAMKGYVDAANTAMKGYVDGQITTVSNSVTGANAAIVTANTAMKGYVDAINSTLTANAGAQAGTLATIQSTYAQLAGASFSGAVFAPNITLTTALPITSGGTGGTSASEALNNLFPSGETSGYVLKTSGPGSYYWAASDAGAGGAIGTTITTSRVYKTATAGQTVFTGLGTYTPGAGQLRIYLNGVRQFDSAYTETNSSAVTLSTGVSSGTVLLAEIDGYSDFTSYASDVVVSPVGTVSAINVQDAIAELDTEKAALSGATFTGNISVPYITGATTVTGNLTVGGNLNVLGNVTSFDSNNVTIQDALIYMADDNGADLLDIGFVSSFTNATRYQHTGLARDATDGTWKLFANVVAEPTTTIDFTNATYSNLRIGQLTSTGVTATGPATVGNLTANNTSITGTMSQDGVTGGIVPVGGIIMWSGSIATIPTRWALCDGTNSTPDLRDRFIVGAGSTYAVGATGGSKDAIVVSHSHTATSTFTGDALGAHGHSASSSSTFTGTSMAEHNHGASASSSFSGSTLPSHTHVATSTVTDPGHVHSVSTTADGQIGTARFVNGSDGTAGSLSIDSATTGITVGTTLTSVSAGTPSGSVSTSVSVGLMSAGVPDGSVSTSTSITGASAGTPSGSVSTTVNTTGSSGTNANLPPYYSLAYIMRIS